MVLFSLLCGEASSVGAGELWKPPPNHDQTEVSNSSSGAAALTQLSTRHDPTNITEVRILMLSGLHKHRPLPPPKSVTERHQCPLTRMVMAVERDTYRHVVLRHLAVTEGIRELTHLSLLDPRVARPPPHAAGLIAPSAIFAAVVVVGHNDATRIRCPDADFPSCVRASAASSAIAAVAGGA